MVASGSPTPSSPAPASSKASLRMPWPVMAARGKLRAAAPGSLLRRAEAAVGLAAAAMLLAGAEEEGLGLPLATMGKGWPRSGGGLRQSR